MSSRAGDLNLAGAQTACVASARRVSNSTIFGVKVFRPALPGRQAGRPSQSICAAALPVALPLSDRHTACLVHLRHEVLRTELTQLLPLIRRLQ